MKGGMYMAIFYDLKWKSKKVIEILVVVCVFLYTIAGATRECFCAEENISMYSGSYALTDGDTGRVLKGKKEEEPMANASTTKILTCIVTLEHCSLEDEVTISANAVSQPKVRLGMKEGENYSIRELLYGLMLESYNDCAVAIAEHVAGSVQKFAMLLNQKAKEIGCKNTYFITPNGLDATDEYSFHHTTASDLCRMMAYCVWESPKKDLFLQITQTRNYGDFVNRNAFLNQMEGVLSGKTGFTNKAGYCYVAAMERNGERYCIALLACGWPNNKTYKWKDARTLFEYGMENYDQKKITIEIAKRQMKVDGYIENAEFSELNKENVLPIISKPKEYQILMSDKDKIHIETILYTDTKLPIKEGQVMGVCNVYLEDICLDNFSLVACKSVNIWGWRTVFYTIFYQFLTFSL